MQPQQEQAISIEVLHDVERTAFINMVKSDYAVFRSTQMVYLFDYSCSIQNVRDIDKRYNKYSKTSEMRSELERVFRL